MAILDFGSNLGFEPKGVVQDDGTTEKTLAGKKIGWALACLLWNSAKLVW